MGRGTGPRWLLVLWVVAVLAGCAACTGAGSGDPRPVLPSDGSILVTYARSGGVAGEQMQLTVSIDGAATLEGRWGSGQAGWTRQVPDDQLDALRSSLQSAPFDALEPSYGPAGVCSDCFVHRVGYGRWSVTVEGGAGPEELAEPLRRLRELAAG